MIHVKLLYIYATSAMILDILNRLSQQTKKIFSLTFINNKELRGANSIIQPQHLELCSLGATVATI